jgi:hypothetical protein
MVYDRYHAVAYAHEWAFSRNPRYLDFKGIGGDCTNFVSQCLLAGGARMNYKKTFGWYYNSANDRAPAWTGVQYLYNFLVKNQREGPYGMNIHMEDLEIGDIVQLAFSENYYTHALVVVETGNIKTLDNILIAAHSEDSDYRPLSSYEVVSRRFIKIAIR